MNSAAQILNDSGWIHLDSTEGAAVWENLSGLGDMFYLTDIRLDPTLNQYAYRPEAFPMHTDAFDARYVAWHVVDADHGSCPMRIADVSGFEKGLSAAQLELLQKMEITYYERLTQSLGKAPLIFRSARDVLAFNFFPTNFAHIRPKSPAEKLALTRFHEVLLELPFREVHLKDGDVLILDNHRMIHGRGPMNATSTRWLRRAWINCNGKYASERQAAA